MKNGKNMLSAVAVALINVAAMSLKAKSMSNDEMADEFVKMIKTNPNCAGLVDALSEGQSKIKAELRQKDRLAVESYESWAFCYGETAANKMLLDATDGRCSRGTMNHAPGFHVQGFVIEEALKNG